MNIIFGTTAGATNEIIFKIDGLNEEVDFIPVPQTQGINYPNIEVATTEVVEVIDYPLLNGIYTKGFDPAVEIYFIRDDGEYYFWDSSAPGAPGDTFWRFESLIAFDFVAESPWINNQDLLIPSQNWKLLDSQSTPIPLKIIRIG